MKISRNLTLLNYYIFDSFFPPLLRDKRRYMCLVFKILFRALKIFKTETILKISKQDAFKQYIAYHEGWGNFKNYKKNKKVINLAKKVEKQSFIYKKQLSKCKNSLNKNKYIIF